MTPTKSEERIKMTKMQALNILNIKDNGPDANAKKGISILSSVTMNCPLKIKVACKVLINAVK